MSAINSIALNADIAVTNHVVPAGVVWPFAGSAAPTGYLLCDGAAYARTGTYAALFAAIGTTFGAGDGSTTFNVPDSRGRPLVGIGTNADVSTLGNSDGLAVASRTPRHSHTISSDGAHSHGGGTGATAPGTDSQGAHTHNVYGSNWGYTTYTQGGAAAWASGSGGTQVSNQSHYHGVGPTDSQGSHGHTVNSHTHSIGTDGSHSHGGATATGFGGYLVVNHIIKY